MTRPLPVWLADGAKVSQLAYRVVTVPFGDPPRRHGVVADLDGATSISEVVGFLADRLAVDEADVLRALAELQRVGAFEVHL